MNVGIQDHSRRSHRVFAELGQRVRALESPSAVELYDEAFLENRLLFNWERCKSELAQIDKVLEVNLTEAEQVG